MSTKKHKPVIGFLGFGPSPLYAAFLEGLRELGHIDGQNITVESRITAGQNEPLPTLAAELVQLKVDVLVAGGTQAVQAAKDATRTIPIVMAVSGDAVTSGLVMSLARPGGNVTGMTILSSQLAAKRLELLKEVVPGVTMVSALWNPTNASHRGVLDALNEAGRSLAVRVEPVMIRTLEEIERAFGRSAAAHSDAVIILGDHLTVTHRSRIAALAKEHRLPSMYEVRDFVEAGGLIAYGVSLPFVFRRAASFVDRILKGEKPAEMAVEQPPRFELVINLKAAKAIGVKVPESLLARADEIIQ